jgi:queuine/archaeosine tRNA-ribosyltransferase
MQGLRTSIENNVFEKYVKSFYEQRGKAVPDMA